MKYFMDKNEPRLLTLVYFLSFVIAPILWYPFAVEVKMPIIAAIILWMFSPFVVIFYVATGITYFIWWLFTFTL